MTKVRTTMERRPWLAPLATAAVAALLLMIPVSYHITSGYSVRLRLDLPESGAFDLGPMAADLGRALGTEHVTISTSFEGRDPELLARVTSADRVAVEKAVRLFTTGLSTKGIGSELTLAPVHSLVSGNLYAMGFGRAFRFDIRRQGRSGTDIERDITRQLEASGVSDARVAYREKDGCSLVQILVGGPGSDPASAGDGIQVALICSNPEATCPVPCSPSCRRVCPASGDVQVTVDGRAGFVCSAEASLPSVAGMSDDAIARELAAQLRSKGVDAEVVVRNGQVISLNPVCVNR